MAKRTKITVNEAVENFLRSKSLKSSDHHLRTITSFMDRFREMYGHRRVAALTLDDMEEYAVYLANIDVRYAGHPTHHPVEGKLSKSTIDAHHRTLRSFFNWMIKRPEYGVTSNPMLEVTRPRIFEGDTKIKRVEWVTYLRLIEVAKTLTPEDVRARAIALLYFLPDTGCRAEGVCKLKWSDVDLAMRQARVVEKFGKKRTVFFMPNTRVRLELWRQHAPKDTEYVFCSLRGRDQGQQLTTDGLYQIVIGVSEKAGLPRDKWVPPHALRHMFATYADESGIQISHLQALMGHERSDTTRHYVHRSEVLLQNEHDEHSPLRRLMVKK